MFHVVSFVGAILGVINAVWGWMILSTPIPNRTGAGVMLALGAAGVWISFAGWFVYRRALDKGTDLKFSQTLIWVGVCSSMIASLGFIYS